MSWQITNVNTPSHLKDDFDWPYQDSFIRWVDNTYRRSIVWVKVCYDEKNYFLLPINIDSHNRGHCPFKSYVLPLLSLDLTIGRNDWNIISLKIKEKLNLDCFELTLAFDLAGPSTMSTYLLDLNDVAGKENILRKFSKKTRNEIRKALHSNWETRSLGREDLPEVYELYKENMRRHKSLTKPFSYFESLSVNFGQQLWILGVFLDNKLVATNISLVNRARLRLLFNLSRIDYWQKCVNDYVYYKMIEQGFEWGVRLFDFGPTGDRDLGHIRFKKGFGGIRRPIIKIQACSRWPLVVSWLMQKMYNLRIRFKKYGFRS